MASGFHIDRSEKAISDSSSASLKDGSVVSHESLVRIPNITTLPPTLDAPHTDSLRPASSWSTESVAALASDDGYPEGGLLAWSVVGGGWCAQFCSVGWTGCMGILQTQYERHQLQGYSSSAVAWIISLNTFLTFAGAPFFGRVFDSHGPRGMMLLGITMHVLGLMMTSLSTKYWHFVLAQSICSGMGSGAILYASLNSVATWFRERRALALGIASSGSGVSGIVTPIVFNKLRVEIGFAWAIRCIAFMFLGLLTVAALTVRSRLRPNSEPWRLADFAHPFKSRCFVSTTLAAFVFHMGLYVPMNYITLQALDEGMSENLAGYLISIMNGASVLGRILLGRLGDKAGRYNCLIGSASVSALVVLLVWLPGHGNAAFIVFSALVGFSLGGYIALLPACVAQVAEIQRIGVYNGVNWVCAASGTLIGTPIGGALIRQLEGGGRQFAPLIIFTGGVMWLGVFLYTVARTAQVGLPSKI